nr:pro-resilin-like [Cherax quadricarinatus]
MSTLLEQPGMPHKFAYNVKDDYGTNFGHNENSDGNTVRGSYNVDLPDGRKQTMNYEADHHKGYVADVEYQGEAKYPYTSGPAVTFKPQPSYRPENSYHPQPSHKPQPSYQL